MARSNQKVVPEAKAALDKFKYEVASDMCVKNIFKHHLLATFLNPPSLRDTSLSQGRQVFLAFSNPPSGFACHLL